MLFNSVTELVGGTPLLQLNNYKQLNNLHANIYAKLECFNPTSSVKDRVGLAMIKSALATGQINHTTTIIEPTSGNTGIAIASVCASMGIKAIFTMPDTMSVERRKLLSVYGAEIVLTDGKLGMTGAINHAKKLLACTQNSYMPSQFTNQSNPQVHFDTTAPEIFSDLNGKIDIFVSGIGTGGTLTGCSRYFKQRISLDVVAVEPSSSPVLSQGISGSHKIQGIGAGFVPETLDTSAYDYVETVSNEQAFITARTLARQEGIFTGISSGASLYVATKLALLEDNSDKNIVVILPDTGERYLSTALADCDL